MTDVSPMPGSLVKIYYASGAGTSYSDEAMEEVDLSPTYERYTVYRITDAAKRIMTDASTPTFQWQDGGEGDFATLTPSAIWYAAGYIILSTALDGTDVVRCHTGNYQSPTQIFACAKRDFEKILGEQDTTVYGDSARSRDPTIKDWNGTLDILYAGKQATAVSSGGAANSHIRAYHLAGGTAGNGATFDLQDTDAGSITITVTDDDIVVELETSGGDPVSTASEVVAALNADDDVNALGIWFKVEDGETGAGVVADSGPYTLAGGLEPQSFEDLEKTVLAFRFYSDYDNGIMDVGFGFITNLQYTGGPADFLQGTMTVTGAKHPMYRVTES